MQPCYFNDVQQILLDPRNQTDQIRQQATVGFLAGKVVSGGVALTSGLLALSSLVSCTAFPIIGGLGVAFWGAAFILSKDAFTIVANGENIASSLYNRTSNAFSSSVFLSSLFKDTTIAGPRFGQVAVEMLNSQKNR